jgi:hypothetical protein
MQTQAFEADRQTDDVSLAILAKQRGNRVDNGIDKAIHDRTSRASALKRGTKWKNGRVGPTNDLTIHRLATNSVMLYSSFPEIRGDVKANPPNYPHINNFGIKDTGNTGEVRQNSGKLLLPGTSIQ